MAALVALLAALSGAGCISIDLLDDGRSPLEESVVRGRSGPKILLIGIEGPIDGELIEGSLLSGERVSMVARVREVLDRAREDDEVRAILLRIDSPGGTATASEQIRAEIRRFAREREVPVVAQLLSTATSGGYYVAMAADHVQAHPTTVTGSIGVVFTSISLTGLMDFLGVENQSVRAGRHKGAGSPLRRMSEEERAQIQSIVDELHAHFRRIVGDGRPDLSPERIAELADGRLFSARQALDAGLVDGVGTLEDAIVDLEQRLGAEETRVVTYHRQREVRRNVYSGSELGAAGLGTLSAQAWMQGALDRLLVRPGFHYLWWPGRLD